MHKVTIPDHIRARVRKSRGGDHHFETLDMSRVAHVCIDMQVGFVAEGAPIEVPMTREIAGTINAVSAAVRAAGGLNVFTRYTYDRNEKIDWSAWLDNYLSAGELAAQARMARGLPDWEISPLMELAPGDVLADKTRFSALIPETCDMDARLRARGIDTLIITGTLTNCCCESTARDALQMGYKVIFLSDANATLSDEEHLGTLISMYTIFADVMDTPALLELIARSGARAAA